MPGENCCIPGCGSCRNTKGLGFFKLPSVRKDHFKERRKKWLDVILKVRELDGNLKRQLEEDTLHTCDLHFHHDEYEISKQFLFNLVP